MKLDEMNLEEIEINFFKDRLSQIPLNQKDEYLSLFLLYRKLFTKYIIEKTNLKQIDELIKNSDLKFVPIKEEKMDIYQYITCDEMDFFYIRNNIYIDNLSENDMKFLKDILNMEKIDNFQVEQFIARTYPKAIFNDPLEKKKTYTVFYGPETLNYSAQNNALVIGMRYDLFNKNGQDDKEYMANYSKQRLFLQKLFKKIISDFEENLNIPCSIIEYNEFSVTPKNDIIR